MIFEVHVWKTANGKLYVKARDAGQLWDYLDVTDIDVNDVIWEEDEMGDSIEEVIHVKRNKKGKIVEFVDGYNHEKSFQDDSTFVQDGFPHIVDIQDRTGPNKWAKHQKCFSVETNSYLDWHGDCKGCAYLGNCPRKDVRKIL